MYVNVVRAQLKEHHRWTCTEYAREVGIVPGMILHTHKNKFKMRKMCDLWIPHYVKEKTCGTEWKERGST